MTYEIQKNVIGRQVFTIIELDAKACHKIYGQTFTNLITYSGLFDDPSWTNLGGTVISKSETLDQFGTKTAYTLTDNDAFNASRIQKNTGSFNVNSYYCTSVFIERNNIDATVSHAAIIIEFTGGTTETNVIMINTKTGEFKIDYEPGTATFGIAGVENHGRFWRVYLSVKAQVTTGKTACSIMLVPAYGKDWFVDASVTGSAIVHSCSVTETNGSVPYIENFASLLTSGCTAAGGIGNECRNRRVTCQDIPNYQHIYHTHQWSSSHDDMPRGEAFIPCLAKEPSFTSTKILPQLGASIRGGATFVMKDFTYHDIGEDPYYKNRPFNQEQKGTFFGRWLANNPYYINAPIRIKSGYIAANGYDREDFTERTYILSNIKDIQRVKDNIYYTFQCTDILKLTEKSRVLIPHPGDSKLLNILTIGNTASFTLETGFDTALFPVTGTRVRIGDEEISYATRSGDVCSTLVRGLSTTVAEEHDAGDDVQQGLNFTGNPVAIIDEILEKHSGIDGDLFIPYDAGRTVPTGIPDRWDDEITNWLPGININVWFFTPSAAIQYLNELCQSFQIDLWADPITQMIELKTNTPPLANAPVTELNDNVNFLEGKTIIRNLDKKRISTVIFRYAMINTSLSPDVGNFAKQHYENLGSDPDQYSDLRLFEVKSRFLGAADGNFVTQTAQRLVARFGTTPRMIKFHLDAKDSGLKTGDLADITTRFITDQDGNPKTTRFQIITEREIKQGTTFEYEGLESTFFSIRNSFFADNASPQYDAASAAQKLDRAYFAPSSGFFPDGGDPYTFI